MTNSDKIQLKSVGGIVADNFSCAAVFRKYGIDFCCHGDASLTEACLSAGVEMEEVLKDLLTVKDAVRSQDFAAWPTDLLIDYVLKIHHRGIRREGPHILELLSKVAAAHGTSHPELHQLLELFTASLEDLEMHLQKEENVLFPYLMEQCHALENGLSIAPMHCGSVANPIRVMRMEHEAEGDRYHLITRLTDNFTVPADGCNSYRLLMDELKEFMNNLYEHIHLENNIIFPRAVKAERCL